MGASSRPAVPLTIAGSDPSGGAGLQADLKVFLRFGLSGAAVPTALTVQGPTGLREIHEVDESLVKAQLDTLLHDFRPAAVKVGMLPSAQAVRVVARALGPIARKGLPIVIDPVLATSDGIRLLPEEDVPVFLRQLVPLATLLTPNIDEAAELTGTTRKQVREDTEPVVRKLLRTGARAVLIKGGHGQGEEAVDILGNREELVLYSLPRVPRRRHVHGTGCALAAAITALLARGVELEAAVQLGKEFVRKAIAGARQIGRGSRQLDFTVAFEGSGTEMPKSSRAAGAP